ncbi:MAG: hypothetical protein HN350_14240 [Phycisphaerales bacterium]|nr:hypothetical protein [Phycisphaerales bacterium]
MSKCTHGHKNTYVRSEMNTMLPSKTWILGVVLLFFVFAVTGNVTAQVFQDDFDLYAPDSNAIGQGDWFDWGGGVDPIDSPIVRSEFSYSGANSLQVGEIDHTHDTGWAFSGITSGVWEFTGMTYVPDTSLVGTGYIGFMNSWPDAVDFMGSVDLDMAANVVVDNGGGVAVRLVREDWVELKARVDMGAQTIDTYYDGVLLNSQTWAGTIAIAGIDFWGPQASSPVFYDDLLFAPVLTVDNTLTWNAGGADGAWGDSNWLEAPGGTPTIEIPTIGAVGTTADAVVVAGGNITVGGNQGALSLDITDGSVTIAPGSVLEVYTATTVTAPGVLTINGTLETESLANDGATVLGASAVLKTDTGVLVDIDTLGDATFVGGSTVTTLSLAPDSTFTKGGSGLLDVSSVDAIADTNIIQIDRGELNLHGVAPLLGASLVLNGGQFTADGGVNMSTSSVLVNADATIHTPASAASITLGDLTFDADSVLTVTGGGNMTVFASSTVNAGLTAEIFASGQDVHTGAVGLGDGAKLLTRGGVVSMDMLTLNGPTGAIGRIGDGELVLGSYGGGSKVLTITGGGRTVLNMGALAAVGTKFIVEGGSTLAGPGPAPLSGATELELAGGTFELDGAADLTGVTTTVVMAPAIPGIPAALGVPEVPEIPSAPSASVLNTNTNSTFGELSFIGDGVVTTTGAATQVSFTQTSVAAGVTGGIVADAQTVDAGPIVVSDGGVFVGGTTNGGTLNYTDLTLADANGGIGAVADQTVTIRNYDDGGAAQTLLIGGEGTTLLDYTGSFVAGNTALKVVSGTLELSGGTPLGGARELILAGGDLNVHVPVAGPPAGAVAYYSFENVDAVTGVVSNDVAGSTLYDGTLTNGASVTTGGDGQIGDAMTIGDNTTQYLSPADGGIPLGSDWTIAAWVFDVHPDDMPRVLIRTGDADYLGLLMKTDNRVAMRAEGDFSYSELVHLEEQDGWHHLVLTGTGGETTFFVDGVQGETFASQATAPIISVGSFAGSFPFAAKIDEFVVYNSVLTPGEIGNLIEAGQLHGYFVDMSSLSMKVEGVSTLNLTGGDASLGALTFTTTGAELTIANLANFTGLAIDPSVESMGINTEADVLFGAVDGGLSGAEIIKGGSADLVLSGTGADLDGASFTVQDGRLIAITPLPIGPAALHPAGGEIVLGSTTPGDVIAYTNAITSDGGTITAGGPGASGVTVNLTSGLTLDSGELELRTDSGNTLNVTGPVLGDGTVDIGAGASVTLAGSATPYEFGGVAVTGGAFTADHSLILDKLDVVSGTFVRNGAGAGTQNLTVASSLTISSPLDMTGASLDVTTAAVTVINTVLAVDAPLAAARMDLSEGGQLALGGHNMTLTEKLMTMKGEFIMSGPGSPVLVSRGDINPTLDPVQMDLAGGTLKITGLGESLPNQLVYTFYDYPAGDDAAAELELAAIDDGIANGQNGGLFALTPTPDVGTNWPAAVQGKGVWTGEVWQAGNMSDYYSQMWSGTFNAPETGVYTFYVHGDDHEVLWLDADQNGEYEAGTDDITRNLPTEGWNTPKTGTVALVAGESYEFALAHNEGNGGDFVEFTIQTPSSPAPVRINPSDPGQAYWWSVGTMSTSDIIMPNTDLLITADSMLEVWFDTELGVLKLDGADLVVDFDVLPTRTLTFQSVAVEPGASSVTFSNDGNVWLTKSGGISAGGASVITKNGSGELILSDTISDLGASPVLNVNEGTLTLGQGGLLSNINVQVGDAGLKLSTPLAQAVQTYDDPITFNGAATILAGMAGSISNATGAITYDMDIDTGANALTLGSTDGYTLNIGSAGSLRNVTAGQLDIAQGVVNISGDTVVAGDINVSGGTVSFGQSTAASNLNVSGGQTSLGVSDISDTINATGTALLTTSVQGVKTARLAIVNTAVVDAAEPIEITDMATIGAPDGGTLEVSVSGDPVEPGDSFTLAGSNLTDYANTANTLNLQGGTTKIEMQPSGDMSVRYVRVTGDQINNVNEADGILDGTLTRTIAEDVTVIRDTINMEGDVEMFPNGDPWPNGRNDAGLDDFAVEAIADFFIPEGDWTITFGSDDGGFIQFGAVNFGATFTENDGGGARPTVAGDGEISWHDIRGMTWTTGQLTVPAGGVVTSFRAVMFERGGGDAFEVAIRSGLHDTTAAAVNADDWTLLSSGALGWTIPTEATNVVLPNTTVIAPVDSTLELTALGSSTIVLGGVELADDVQLIIDSDAGKMELTNMTLGGGAELRATRSMSGTGVGITISGGSLVGGDEVSYVGSYDDDSAGTNLTLTNGTTYEWTLVAGTETYVEASGKITLQPGVKINLNHGSGSVNGEDVILLYTYSDLYDIGGFEIGNTNVKFANITITMPENWSHDGLGWYEIVDEEQTFLVLKNLITVVEVEGDANNDQVVDEADMAVLLAQFGSPWSDSRAVDNNADFNDDGFVDLADFVILRGAWGDGASAPAEVPGAETTPEPATMILMAAGLPLLLRRKRKARA